MVESQEHIATLGYVDTLEEQAVLEDLLEESKPQYADGTDHLHYLLKTPFRYPPLLWGSRFGRVFEPSLFYGGGSLKVTLAESAYYRLVFLLSMEGPPPKHSLTTEHSVFTVGYATRLGIQLQHPPFDQHRKALTNSAHYATCQLLGTGMREYGVEAFQYRSARCHEDNSEGALCIGLFSAQAFIDQQPRGLSQWLCETRPDAVVFKESGKRTPWVFSAEMFLVEGAIPLPA